VHDVGKWMEHRRCARIATQDLRHTARKEGLAFAPAHGELRRGAEPRRLRAHLRNHPEATVDDVRAWARKTLHREFGRSALYHFAKVNGHTYAPMRPPKTHGPNRARILDYITTHPEADVYAVTDFMKTEHAVNISQSRVRTFARDEGLVLAKRRTGPKLARSTEAGRASLVEHIRTHPEMDVYAAVEWSAQYGEALSKWDVYTIARKNNLALAKRSHGLKTVTGEPNRSRMIAYITAHPEADADAVVAFMMRNYDEQISKETVRRFAVTNSLALARRKRGPTSPPSRRAFPLLQHQ
jgi:hypothetical protein